MHWTGLVATPAGILRTELDVLAAQVPQVGDGFHRRSHHLVLRHPQLVLHVDLGRREEGVHPRPLRAIDRIPGHLRRTADWVSDPQAHTSSSDPSGRCHRTGSSREPVWKYTLAVPESHARLCCPVATRCTSISASMWELYGGKQGMS